MWAWWESHLRKHVGRFNSSMRCWLPTNQFSFRQFGFPNCYQLCRALTDCSKLLAGWFLESYVFLQSLSLAYAYTYAQDNPTRRVNFFIITFDAKYLPLAMLGVTFVMAGPNATLTQGTGLVAAHLYDFLTRIWPTFGGGRNYIFTPQIVKGWFGAVPGAAQQRSYGTAFQGRPAEDRASARTTGANTTGANPGWNQRGPGRRLGE